MMVDPDLKSTPDGSQPGSNPGYLVDKILGSTNCTLSYITLQFSVFIAACDGAPSCCCIFHL